MEVSAAVEPKSTDSVETTLSLAMKPVISAVEMRQSPKPSGAKIGAIQPATTARMLSCESVTILSRVSNVCRNQITIVAIKMTVNARCRKSFALSQSSRPTFFAPGIR